MLASLSELLVVGAFWFWILVAAEIGILFLCSATEKGFLAALSIAIFGGILQWGSGVDIIGFVAAHPIHAAVAVVLYILCGIVWSVIRWNLYYGTKMHTLVDGRGKWYADDTTTRGSVDGKGYYERHAEAIKQYELHGLPQDYIEKWNKHVDDHAPTAASNKSRICTWMGLFPVSIFDYLLRDFLADLFSRIYLRLSAVYESIANRHKRNAKL